MDKKSLYAMKGELLTQIEIAQAQLQQVNKQIIDIINKESQESVKSNGKPEIAEVNGASA